MDEIIPGKQFVSRERIEDHGEVFTSNREVNAMLDLVKDESLRIDSRFLEPACGTGNFLVEVLKRKLEVVTSRYVKSQTEYELYSIIAVSGIYGVDILPDNVDLCRRRLFDLYTQFYLGNFKKDFKPECLKAAEFILNRNILWGDALSLRTPDAKAEPIIFSEWSAITGGMIKRRDYTMANLLGNTPMEEPNLFSDLGDQAFLPKPIGEYPIIHFLKLGQIDTREL